MAMLQLLDLLFQVHQLLGQVQDLDGLDGVVQDRHGGPNLLARLITRQVAFEGIHGLARGLLQLPQGALDDLPAGATVGRQEGGQLQPVLQRGKADGGFLRGGVDGRLSEQRGDGHLLLPAQFVAVSRHRFGSRLAQMGRFWQSRAVTEFYALDGFRAAFLPRTGLFRAYKALQARMVEADKVRGGIGAQDGPEMQVLCYYDGCEPK
jgi:hypothetical protein